MNVSASREKILIEQLDEGDLSSSLENLDQSPRLRGQIEFFDDEIAGWLLDSKSLKQLHLSLVYQGKMIATAMVPKQARAPSRGRTVQTSLYRFVLRWDESTDYSPDRDAVLLVHCFDGEKYELLLNAKVEDEASPQAQEVATVEFEDKAALVSKSKPSPKTEMTVSPEKPLPAMEKPETSAIEEAKTDSAATATKAETKVATSSAKPEGSSEPQSTAANPPVKSEKIQGDHRIRGYIDTLDSKVISGWAWVENAPELTVEIVVQFGEKVLAKGPASDHRKDLKDARVGTGNYGYTLSLPPCDLGQLKVAARVGSATETIEIPPQFKKASVAPESKTGDRSKPDFEGYIDRLTRWGAVGWAWLPRSPEESPLVEAVHEGIVIGRTIANRLREDLAAHGKGTGKYGFEISFDQPIKNDVRPEFRILAPTTGYLQNTHTLPQRAENERSIPARGDIATLYAEHAKFTSAGEQFEEFDPTILHGVDRSRFDLIAYYLPQFHSIKENDRFWGKGFTEWRQLARGLPRYRGHYQPRTPRDLGFYTLTNVEPLTRQAALAKAAGVSVFGFYYYWFNRTRILDEPIEVFLRAGVEMKFMLIWANENWTRTWDGSESEVLLKQDYSVDDEEALIADWVRHFQDHRYYTIDGRPLFVIYNPKLIPQPKKTIARWRRILESKYDINPLMFMAQTFGMRDPGVYGLDGAIEFPPHKLSDTLPGRPTPDAYSSEFAGRVIEYDDFVKVSLAEEPQAYPLIKTVVPSWDNEARRPNRGLSLELASPAKYENWLSALISRAARTSRIGGHQKRSVVAVNAWNEWAEGAYLEPDVHFGAAYLNATARAIKTALSDSASTVASLSSASTPAVTVILPNYNHAKFLPERISSVLGQTLKPAEVIFLDDCSSDNSVEVARGLLEKSAIPHKIIVNKKNSGNVFKQWMRGLQEASSEWIWIAETDDSADHRFLEHLSPLLQREDVLAAYGKISFINSEGKKSRDLDGYYDDLQLFDWNCSNAVPAFKAFEYDFTVKNVIPNASGLVFKKPVLTETQIDRLYQYKFAGDWYFYALMLRGGRLGYSRDARSYFRVSQGSASRSAFFTERHLAEHQMVIEDLRALYDVPEKAVLAHAQSLASHFPDKPLAEVEKLFQAKAVSGTLPKPLRICIAAHSFEIGGGELLPVTLANTLHGLGHHVTYLVMEKERSPSNLRSRLRADISVVYWCDIQDRFEAFLDEHGIQVFNSHNVSVEYQLFCRGLKMNRPYVASLHGGYETVADLLKGEFAKYLSATVSKWLFLAEKNVKILTDNGIPRKTFEKSFNAVPQYEGVFVERSKFVSEQNIPADALILVQCSRAIKEKGWRDSILAVKEVAKTSQRPLHLVLIGDGPDLGALRHEFQDEKQVTFMGHVDTPVRFFRCFDLATFPSYYKGETFPLFILECFQQGVPVIASRIGEIPQLFESVDGSVPGELVNMTESGPDFKALVQSISKAANDKNALGEMKEAATKAGKRFDMSKLADFYVGTCQGLLNR